MHTLTDDYPAARADLTRACAIFEGLSDIDGQVETLNNLGNLARTKLDADTAMIHYRKALWLARQIGTCLHEAHALEGIGRCLLHDSSISDSITYLRQALAIYQRLGVPEAKRLTAILTTVEPRLSAGVEDEDLG
jgi:tetratricopeptide (TPR) repeat protein